MCMYVCMCDYVCICVLCARPCILACTSASKEFFTLFRASIERN